jgi:hypothetical protein
MLLGPLDHEPHHRSVSAPDLDLVAAAELAQPKEHRRAPLESTCPRITADPGSPGRAPSAYQPATSQRRGSWTVPSGARPSRSRALATPILGITIRTGTGVPW